MTNQPTGRPPRYAESRVRKPCPTCGASTLVTKADRLRKHKRDTGAWRMEWCPGSGHAVL